MELYYAFVYLSVAKEIHICCLKALFNWPINTLHSEALMYFLQVIWPQRNNTKTVPDSPAAEGYDTMAIKCQDWPDHLGRELEGREWPETKPFHVASSPPYP